MFVKRQMAMWSVLLWSLSLPVPSLGAAIDRQALVHRHHPHLEEADVLSPFTVGNGQFAFTTDVTGLQTFASAYEAGIPLSTQSEWGWHSCPNEADYQLEETMEPFRTGDRDVRYPTLQESAAGQFLRANPHRLGLGQIGLILVREDGSRAELEDLTEIDQTLDLWRGRILSRFHFDGEPVTVETAVHPGHDLVALRIESPLLAAGQLGLSLRFAYGSDAWGIVPEDWSRPEAHETSVLEEETGRVLLSRKLDGDGYFVRAGWDGEGALKRSGRHSFELLPKGGASLAFTVEFSPGEAAQVLPDAEDTLRAAASRWEEFWTTGAAVDFSGSTDPRAQELERRVVLSQYLTRIQCAGSMPPQETGLTFNSWYGKPHLEMHWWHGVHFALWDRLPLLEKSLSWYERILPEARAIARNQGYDGARWPKMVGPEGGQGPSTIAPLLIWQQPHPIYFAELVHRQRPGTETLERYGRIVEESAAFMASFAQWNEERGRFDLGPPLIPAQESYDPRATKNPPFELSYWRWGLEMAQEWRERRGLPRNAAWQSVLDGLAALPVVEDGELYATAEGIWNTVDHPTVLGAKGFLPGEQVDDEGMRRTLQKVMQEWPWEHTWGWDYPLVAMTAARLGEPTMAVDALLLDVPKNRYLPNGHNWQEAGRLPIYLPGNGGLLTAVAMMAAGWDGAPHAQAPGFPDDGSWSVRWEHLRPMP